MSEQQPVDPYIAEQVNRILTERGFTGYDGKPKAPPIMRYKDGDTWPIGSRFEDRHADELIAFVVGAILGLCFGVFLVL